MGIAGLVFGILSLILCWVPILGLILGIVGIIFSAIGMAKNKYKGCGIGGLVTSIIGGVIGVIITVISVVAVPQVVNWTDNSRKSTDSANYDALVSMSNLAMMDEKAIKELDKGDISITMTKSGVQVKQDGMNMSSQSAFVVASDKILPGFRDIQLKASYTKNPVITITKDSKEEVKVEKTVQPL